jgi:predicted small lipoprotein YifL
MLAAALGAATLLAACGQKGPLYLPKAEDAEDERQPRSATSESITTPAIPTAPAPGMVE